jgi:hypothetical protein
MDDDYEGNYDDEEYTFKKSDESHFTRTKVIDDDEEEEKPKTSEKPAARAKRGGGRAKKEEGPQEEKIIRIKEFDLSTMNPTNSSDYSGVKICVIGKPNTGKSTLVQSIIAAKAHICPAIQVFNGTEESSKYYSQVCPTVFVHDRLDMDALVNFVRRQRLAVQYLENPWAILIIDDCTDDPKQLRHPLIQNLFKNGRHLRLLFFLVLQYALDILPSIRTSIDYTFILREPSKKTRKKLYENYCPDVVTEEEFYSILDSCTENYGSVVICNRTVSNKIEDCIFYYKADPNAIPPTLKLGHQTAWEFNHERFDPMYEPDIMGGATPGQSKKKK